jgi:amino acid adenylation domain-containing protein
MVMDAVDGVFHFEEREIKLVEDLEYLRETGIRLLDPYASPVFGVYLIQRAGGKQMLLLFAHDVILDSLSWLVLQSDLEQLLSGNTLRDVPSFQKWCDLIQERVKTNDILQELASEGWAGGDYDSNILIHESKHLRGQTAVLDSETCHLLFGDGCESLQVRPWQIVLAALTRSYNLVFCDRKPPSIAAQINGRDIANPSLDFSHTAGRFDSILVCPGPRNLGRLSNLDLVRRIRDSAWLSLVDDMARALPSLVTVDILLHNLITSDASSMGQPDGSHPKQPTPYSRCSGLLELVATGTQNSGTIELTYTYSDVLGDPELLNQWFSQFQQNLAEILNDLVKASTMFTLISFPFLHLKYEELKRLETEHFPKIGIRKHVELCDAYPCSPIQEGMLLAQAVMPSRYKVRAMWRAGLNNQQEKVCIERLKDAWSAVVRRHPALRTVFVPHPRDINKYIQLVLSPSKADNAARALNSFDDQPMHGAVSNSPIAQMTLQKLLSGEVDCRLDVDHTVADGLSLQILMRDLALAYDYLLPSKSLQPFRQHIIHQGNLCREDSKAYWASRLQDCIPCQFPTLNNKENDIPGRSANFYSMKIELEALSRLYDLSHKYGLTMANIFQVAWALVLQTFTNQKSVCFGYMVAGRNSLEGIWDAVGLFTNMVVRTIDLNPTNSLLDVLQEAQKDFADSLPYQQISASEVFEHLGIASRHLFNTMLSFVNVIEDRTMSERSLRLEATDVFDHSEYDIALDGIMQGESITARIKYWDSVLNKYQAQTLASVFQQALNVLATSSQQPLSEIYLLSDRDTRQIMEWNISPPDTVDGCIHEYIDKKSKTQPLAPAVEGWNGSFTYHELSTHSSCLAKHLAELGVHPGEIVPLCLEKSCWTPVAMLAVLKAGAAFVLLNPSLPSKRLQGICEITGARALLTSRENAALCTELGLDFIVIEEQLLPSNSNSTKDWIPPARCGKDLAYVVFTSGSTGTPKGAMIQHSAFISSALRYGPHLNLSTQTRTFQQCSYSFDISISDHLATLLAGGCICIPSDAEVKSDLSTAIRKLRANWAMITPSVSRILQAGCVPCLKTLCLIGEPLTASDVRSWSKHVALINTYGPAETACVSHSSLALMEGDEIKCIGKGLGTVSWIVCQDDPERLMPVGTVGELLIDGPIVGKGYLKDPEKTNAAFIDCPSWMSLMRPGYQAKLYKTGDLVRYMDDGSILFCGRKNTQVKVQGQWVELSEVENYSRQCFPGASQFVVEYVENESLMVGFVVLQDGRLNNNTGSSSILLPDTAEFQQSACLARRRMLDLVPGYMIPAAFIPVRQIPLRPTGKADRQQFRDILNALSPRDLWKYVVGEKEIVIPSTGLETKLHQIYASVLGAPAEVISVEDDFFYLGGNSLAAMKISSRAQIDGLQMSFADVFQHRTIRLLARSIESDAPSPLPEKNISAPHPVLAGHVLETLSHMQISKADVEDFLPCTPLQKMMLCAQLHEKEIYTLRFSVQITSESFSVQAANIQEAWQAVIDRHAILRTVFIPTGEENAYTQAILTKEAARHSLTKLPYRVAFTQDTLYAVTLTGQMNHAVGDAASTAIILDDLRRIYSNELLETPAPQFSQYVQYIDASSKRAMEYWLEYFLNASPCLFPHQHTDIRGHLHSVPVSIKKDFEAISRSCQQGEITVPTLIKSVWAMTLAFWTRTDSVCFGYLVSGRDVPIAEVEKVVGPLVNLLVCRLDLKLQHSLGDVLGDVQSDYAQSLSHHPGIIPALEQLEQALSGPLFNTLVNHRQFPSPDPKSIGDSHLNFRTLSLNDPMAVCSIQTPFFLLSF